MTLQSKPSATEFRFSGRESTRLLWVLFVMMSVPLFPVIQLYTGSATVAMSWLGIVAIAYILFYSGARWQLTIDKHGITLQRWKFWIVPHPGQQFSLDVEFSAYYSVENFTAADIAEGFEIIPHNLNLTDRVRFGPDSTSCNFAPLLQEIQRALAEIRTEKSLALAA